MLIRTKTMRLFIGEGVKILICTTNWFPVEALPVLSVIVNDTPCLSELMEAQ